MKPAPLPEEPQCPALPYEVAFSRVPTDMSSQGLDPAHNEGRPVYIRAYDIATIPPQRQGDAEQVVNVSQAINQAAIVSQAVDQIDVTPSDNYPGYVEQTNH